MTDSPQIAMPLPRKRSLPGGEFLKRLVRAPGALVAAIVILLLVMGALLAPWLAQTNPYDLASLDLLDSHQPPAFMEAGDPRFLLGTDSQGADVAP
jgi:peptide/nickel transport system permease protein